MISGIAWDETAVAEIESSKSPLSFKLSGPFKNFTVTVPKAILAADEITNSMSFP